MLKELPQKFKVLVRGLKLTDTLSLLDDIIISHYSKQLQYLLASIKENLATRSKVAQVVREIERIYNFHLGYVNYLSAVPEYSQALLEKLLRYLSSNLEWDFRQTLKEQLKDLFDFLVKYYLNHHRNPEDEENMSICINENVSFEEIEIFIQEKCKPLFQKIMVDLNLIKMLDEDYIMLVLMKPVYAELKRTVKGIYDLNFVAETDGDLLEQLQEGLAKFLKLIFNESFQADVWKNRLKHLLYTSYTQIRIGEFLTVVTSFPDSGPAIDDLKFCLKYTGLRPLLVKSLQKDFRNRVLHSGVKSQTIIEAYISAVKALRELDDTGVVMEIVLQPCSNYLRERDDAVRQIMHDLLNPTDHEKNDLAEELSNLHSHRVDHLCWEERITKTPSAWCPDSRETNPSKAPMSNKHRRSDIISLFINMYGSKEKFIKEYQKWLSKRLQHNWFKNADESNEVRNLELFKLRFGEEEVSKCTVMFKDFADSRRINDNFNDSVAENTEDQVLYRTLIISNHFWPDMTEHDIELPAEVQQSFDKFNKDYERLQASRSLELVKGAGSVDLELEFSNGSRPFKVNPVLATIILKFGEQDVWSVDELSTAVKITPTSLRKKLSYWVQQGVIKSVKGADDTYEVVDEITTNDQLATSMNSMQEVDDPEDEEDKECDDEEDDNSWSYVKGMLTNLGTLSADRIFNMISMCSSPDSQFDISKLKEILNKKIQEGLLSCDGGRYQLVTN